MQKENNFSQAKRILAAEEPRQAEEKPKPLGFGKSIENDNFEGVFQTMEDTNHIKKILKGIESNGK